MTRNLADRKCRPCQGGEPPLKGAALSRLCEQIGAGWTVVAEHHLEKTYKFGNFRDALDFTDRVGELAEGVAS